ncbi:hypothetical protein LTR62_001396 [Meristemomyces frigidus]|uniref:Uncharacterized protein n=1 Tax=Meristemomyces frigidus TaxID=1508187 RepID=A0AAN7TFP8_9PEZI|nr:hypothetical protein LTR62_001396 [Meristemomyces frigidus]
MADKDSSKIRSRGRSFLEKSKWGKVFKENDAPPVPGSGAAGKHVNSFKLNEDVVDFLKPSTEKSKPKLDVAIAKRWPEAHEVLQKGAEGRSSVVQTLGGQGQRPNVPPWTGYRRSRRREGLMVNFAKTAPDVIGEGGDEAPDPPAEISRRRVMVSRSVSAYKSSNTEDGISWPGSPPLSRPTSRQAAPGPAHGDQDDFRPSTLGRADTSHNEFSPPVQRKFATPPVEAVPHRPSLGRTPTGFSDKIAQLPLGQNDYESDEDMSSPPDRPAVDTGAPMLNKDWHFDSPVPLTASTVSSSRTVPTSQDPSSPLVVRRRDRDMQASEGMALRRASTLYTQDQQAGNQRQDLSAPLQPSGQFYDALSNLFASKLAPEDDSHVDTQLSPDSAVSATGHGPSPFEDPRYMKRRSGDAKAQQATPRHDTDSTGRSNDLTSVSYMRAGQQAVPQLYDEPRTRPSRDIRPSYMPAAQPSDTVQITQDSGRSRSRSPLQDRMLDSNAPSDIPKPIYAQSNGSSGDVNRFPASMPFHTNGGRPSPREGSSPEERHPARSQTSPEERFQAYRQSPHSSSPQSSLLGPANAARAATSPYIRGSSPADYFSATLDAQSQAARSTAAGLRVQDAARPGSAASSRSFSRPIPSAQPSAFSDATTDRALADFAARVAHMKGVFSLTAEKERPPSKCSPRLWLRAALWWYLKGKAGLERLLQQRAKAAEPLQELLLQPHVDLAKVWWIFSEHLDDDTGFDTSQTAQSPASASQLSEGTALLGRHIKSLCVSMQRSQLMPPHHSLIQGQSTTIWTEYPRFAPSAEAVLSGAVTRLPPTAFSTPGPSPIEALPLGDDHDIFCFGRFPVEVSVNTDEAETDRVNMPCFLTMLRGKHEFLPSIIVAAQSDLVSLTLGPRQIDQRGLSWHDVTWKASSCSLSIQLPRGFDLTVRMQDRDYRALSNMLEYARRIERSFKPLDDETLVHEAPLAELQYADSSGSDVFPTEKLPRCMALVFERTLEHRDGSGARKMHRGFRLLLVTDPAHKSLSSVSHDICGQSPLLFEFITDAAAQGTTAMVLRVLEDGRQCRMLLVFSDMAGRQALYDVLNGLSVSADEAIVSKVAITGLNIQSAAQTTNSSPISSHPALQPLQWQKLGITNYISDDSTSRIAATVASESLRLVVRHSAGCITDRLNLGKGELLFRLPCAAQAIPAIQILREPQEDLTMSIDVRQAPQEVVGAITGLSQLAQTHSTVRTFIFATADDLHTFQTSTTGFSVAYDGIASTFGIAHRMAMVPIYQKKQASSVRLQVVQRGNLTQVLAFMEDFVLADALCFQIRSTDTFERVKGDAKTKKWGVKFVDAKFRLHRPREKEKECGVVEGAGEERVRRRFVNLEGLEYAEEHDDITIGFETEGGELFDSLFVECEINVSDCS